VMTKGTEAFETEAKRQEAGAESDVAIALSLYLTTLHEVSTGKEIGRTETNAILPQIYSVLDSPEMKTASDSDKQKFWEYCVGSALFCAGMHGAAEDKETKDAFQKLAGELFTTILPVEPKNVQFTKEGMKIIGIKVENGEIKTDKPSKPTTTTPATGKLGVTFETPKGWKQEKKDGLTVLSSQEDPRIDFRITLLSFYPREGKDIRTFYREVWATLMKQYPDDKYTPSIAVTDWENDGLIAFDGTEMSRTNDTPDVHLHVIEIGDFYLPIVVYWKKDGTNFNINDNRIGEPVLKFLNTLKITGATGHKSVVIDKSQLTGTWDRLMVASSAGYYSSSGNYLGDASSGGTVSLTLNPNGTYEYFFAMSLNGGSFKSSNSSKGKWALEGQTLTLTPTSASKPDQMKPQKYYLFGTGKSQDGKEQRLIMTRFDQPAEIAQAMKYIMNYGNGNSSYNYSKTK
jgi:hypothetical protein